MVWGGGAVAVWTEGGCGGEGLTTGVVRHACRLRRDGTRRFLFWGILLRLDWELLREGRLKVARGRSWQPEIGMEHASRGRRSGNKGVGARWRGRFRIFSARHRSRTKVSHAENSGMTMVFFLWRLLRCRGDVDHGSGHAAPCHLRRDGTRGLVFVFCFEGCCGSRNAKRSFAGRIPKRSLGTTQLFVFVGGLLLFVLRVVAGARA